MQFGTRCQIYSVNKGFWECIHQDKVTNNDKVNDNMDEQ